MSFKHSTRKGVFRTGRHDVNHAEIAEALAHFGPEPFDTTKVGGGFPDLIWPFQGVTVGFEVKRPDGTLTPAQERVHHEWTGGPLFVIESPDEIPAIIEKIQQPTVRRRVIG
jgi:hypothetical protein